MFHKLHAALGGRLRYFVSGGAPLAREIAEFFHAAGLLILEGYGLTETCPALTANRHDNFKFGTVGLPVPGVEVRLGDDGEILARGPNIANGYYQRPEATAEVFLDDGWFATGDIGEIRCGRLSAHHRPQEGPAGNGRRQERGAAEHREPAEGRFAHQPGDGLRRSPSFPDRRPYAGRGRCNEAYARDHGISGNTVAELADNPQIRTVLEGRVEQLNQRLAPYESIKKFVIAREDFTEASNELTPTLKVKRQVVTEKYQSELDALY